MDRSTREYVLQYMYEKPYAFCVVVIRHNTCATDYTAILSGLIGKKSELPWTSIFGSKRKHVLENLKLKLALPTAVFLQLVQSCAGNSSWIGFSL